MANKNYLRITSRTTKQGIKKYVIIDDDVKPTAQDEADLRLYITCGYEIKHKSKERAEKARARAKQTGFGKKEETK